MLSNETTVLQVTILRTLIINYLMSDKDRISPYNVNTISTREVMRIKKNISLGIISWSDTKFFELTS